MLRPGDRAPDFSLPDSTGQPRTLASLLKDRGLVLFFYPGDFTPVCTREVCMVRDLHEELRAAGIAVAGVSPDYPATHERFRARHSIEYALLSDMDKQVIRDYGARGPFGLGVRRVTYLIAPRQTIVEALKADFRVAAHARFVRRAIEQVRST